MLVLFFVSILCDEVGRAYYFAFARLLCVLLYVK
jgi:hypothetical protein